MIPIPKVQVSSTPKTCDKSDELLSFLNIGWLMTMTAQNILTGLIQNIHPFSASNYFFQTSTLALLNFLKPASAISLASVGMFF